MKWLVLLVLLSTVSVACFIPENGAELNTSVKFCSNSYYIEDGLSITQSNIFIDCNGAIIRGSYRGAGMHLTSLTNVTITDCKILNYETGFLVRNSSNIIITENHLIRNMVGISLIGTTDSALYNFDVSLKDPIFVRKSSNNLLSSTNRFYGGEFCKHNFCNRSRSVLERFLIPTNTPQQFMAWLVSQVNPKKSLAEILFEGLANR